MDAIEAIKTRRSVRAYTKQPVSRDVLLDLVDCARMAPSAMNQQVWEFLIITSKETMKRLGELIPNSAWLANAPAGIAVIIRPVSFYVEDGAAATLSLMLAARAHGLGSCWVSGDKQPYAEVVKRALGAPDPYKFMSLVAVGYAAEEAGKEKRPLDSLVHWEKF